MNELLKKVSSLLGHFFASALSACLAANMLSFALGGGSIYWLNIPFQLFSFTAIAFTASLVSHREHSAGGYSSEFSVGIFTLANSVAGLTPIVVALLSAIFAWDQALDLQQSVLVKIFQLPEPVVRWAVLSCLTMMIVPAAILTIVATADLYASRRRTIVSCASIYVLTVQSLVLSKWQEVKVESSAFEIGLVIVATLVTPLLVTVYSMLALRWALTIPQIKFTLNLGNWHNKARDILLALLRLIMPIIYWVGVLLVGYWALSLFDGNSHPSINGFLKHPIVTETIGGGQWILVGWAKLFILAGALFASFWLLKVAYRIVRYLLKLAVRLIHSIAVVAIGILVWLKELARASHIQDKGTPSWSTAKDQANSLLAGTVISVGMRRRIWSSATRTINLRLLQLAPASFIVALSIFAIAFVGSVAWRALSYDEENSEGGESGSTEFVAVSSDDESPRDFEVIPLERLTPKFAAVTCDGIGSGFNWEFESTSSVTTDLAYCELAEPKEDFFDGALVILGIASFSKRNVEEENSRALARAERLASWAYNQFGDEPRAPDIYILNLGMRSRPQSEFWSRARGMFDLSVRQASIIHLDPHPDGALSSRFWSVAFLEPLVHDALPVGEFSKCELFEYRPSREPDQRLEPLNEWQCGRW
ncbi:hypothetical protein [Hyphomonas oceanitis]|uniref:hypothetical protein n=1 Tax=Hyphomonas oceanitis TaxID=81033 RepID=UPI003002A43B